MSARYDLDSHPPLAVLISSVAQHMGLMAVTLVFPLLVAQASGADARLQAQYLALSMLAMGVATLVQAWGGHLWRGQEHGLGRIGSGFLLPAVFTAAYLPAALLAARSGGLPAVAGLTITAGLAEIVVSRFIARLRPFLPIEIVGLTVMMIGIILGIVAFKLMVGLGRGEAPVPGAETGAALITLAVTIGLAVWGGPRLRTISVLVGLAAGIAFDLVYGLGTNAQLVHLEAPMVTIAWPLVVPSFDAVLLPGFLAGALACTLRAFGDVVASQRANDRDWKRPNYANIEAGVLADGIGTLMAGLIGTMGLNSYSASVGLSVATEVRARRVAIGVGLGWIALAFLPGSSSLVLAIPPSVLGGALLFASSYIVLSGIAILGQRMLDARRTVAVGLGLLLGISFDELPLFYSDSLPPVLRSVVSSSLMLGLLTALVLNALFRIGARKSHRLIWQPEAGVAPLRQFLVESGGRDGARSEAVLRLVQIGEEFRQAALVLAAGAPVEVVARFDEYVLELAVIWEGAPLEPGPPPSLDADVDEDAVMNGIALTLMKRLSDRLAMRRLGDGRQELVCFVEQ